MRGEDWKIWEGMVVLLDISDPSPLHAQQDSIPIQRRSFYKALRPKAMKHDTATDYEFGKIHVRINCGGIAPQRIESRLA